MLKPALQEDAREAIEKFAADTADGGPAVLIGDAMGVDEGKLYNACVLLDGGKVAAKTFKVDLPNYGVFDEKRVFAAGPLPGPFSIRGLRIGVPVCEDIWTPEIVECLSETGGEILLVPNGSPFEAGKEGVRLGLIKSRGSRKADCRWSISTRSAGRMRWCSTVRRWSATPTARSRMRCPRGEKKSSSPTGRALRTAGSARRARARKRKIAKPRSITR